MKEKKIRCGKIFVAVMLIAVGIFLKPISAYATAGIEVSRYISKTSTLYNVTIGATVTAQAYFNDISQTVVTGDHITLGVTTPWINITSYAYSDNYGITSGSYATVKRSVELRYVHNGVTYYAGAVVSASCSVSSSGQRTVSTTIGNLSNIGYRY